MKKEVHEAFYRKYNGIFYACANSVYTRSLLGGGEGGRGGKAGNEAKH